MSLDRVGRRYRVHKAQTMLLVATLLLTAHTGAAIGQNNQSGAISNWIDPQSVERLSDFARGKPGDIVKLLPLWQVDKVSAAELDEQEREEVLDRLETTVKAKLAHQGDPTLRLEVMVREVWRPSRLFNLLMFVVPIPGTGPLLATRGGIMIEASVVELKSKTTLAYLSCRKRGGLGSLHSLFGRAGDAKAAMQYCADAILQALHDGQVPSSQAQEANGTDLRTGE